MKSFSICERLAACVVTMTHDSVEAQRAAVDACLLTLLAELSSIVHTSQTGDGAAAASKFVTPDTPSTSTKQKENDCNSMCVDSRDDNDDDDARTRLMLDQTCRSTLLALVYLYYHLIVCCVWRVTLFVFRHR